MKLKDYIQKLQKIAETHPDLPVVYSRDDEGNVFQEVNYEPSVGHFKDHDFTTETNMPNAVCIN